jgi:hypothetical protein
MAPAREIVPKFSKVINLAVHNDGDLPIFREQGLMPALHVDDRKPAVSEKDRRIPMKSFTVRSPRREPVGHGRDRSFSLRPIHPGTGENAADPAQGAPFLS